MNGETEDRTSAPGPARIRWPGLLLIGGAGRRSGKTRLACQLLERFGRGTPIVGVKVTTSPAPESLHGDGEHPARAVVEAPATWVLSEETGDPPGKDTSLMLASGAHRALWLRIRRDHVAEGARALIDRVGLDSVCICESSTLRRVIEPGGFVIVKERDQRSLKPEVEELAYLADRLVLSDAGCPDVPLDDFVLSDRRWSIRAPSTDGPHE